MSLSATDATKVCSKCGIEKPIDAFWRQSRGKEGRRASCKTCDLALYRKRAKTRRNDIPYAVKLKQRDIEGGQICTKCATFKPLDEYYRRRGGYRQPCKPCISKNYKVYTQNRKSARPAKDAQHRERQRLKAHDWYWRNKERVLAERRSDTYREQRRIYQRGYLERRRAAGIKLSPSARRKQTENSRKYRMNNPEKARMYQRVSNARYKARVRQLPYDWTSADEQRMLQYFGNCCAVCEQPLNGLFVTFAADHWIPVSSPECPGTIPTNLVPLCHARREGSGACNNTKRNKDPALWLIKTYGKRTAEKILKRINDYFSWVREQDTGRDYLAQHTNETAATSREEQAAVSSLPTVKEESEYR